MTLPPETPEARPVVHGNNAHRYEVAAEFLQHILAERLSRKDARTRVQEQLAWVNAGTPEPVEA